MRTCEGWSEIQSAMTSFDVAAVVEELAGRLVGARVMNVYHLADSQAVILRLRLEDQKELLVLQAARKVCLTQYEVAVPKAPSQFAAQLRREVNGGVIEGVSQLGFDRIVSIKIRAGERRFELLAELLPRGNVVLLEEGVIKAALFRRAMRDRRVWKGERYKPPPSNTLHPEELRREDLAALLDSDESVGRVLARRLGYGPPYADEICIRAGVGAGEPASAMGPEETRRILDSARKVCAMAKGRESPRIYRDSNGVLVGFSPFELLAYSRHSHEEYGTMNQLVDDYFAELEAAEKRAMREKARAEDEEKRRESVRRLKETADEMLRRAKALREAGSALFGNLGAFQEAVDSARSGKEAATFGPVKLLEATGGKEGKLKVDVSGNVLEFPANADAAKIASSLFDEAKRLERDREKLAAKIGERERMAGRVKEETGAEAPVKRKRKAWYESYRWFTSSDGILVVCARDASSNEALVKKHSKPENPVFHSEVTGAPFVLVQADSEKVPQSTLEEAAQMAASYTTRAWQAGYSSLDVFWVRASQLTKTPPSGEYLGSGAFVVRGRKNYIRGSRLMLAVGAVREEGALRIVAAPERAVASKTATYVRIAPGSIEKRKLAQMVKARLVALAPSDEKREIEAVPTGDISSIMPGKSGEIV